MFALLLAVAIPAMPTAPPPIIITTKTSVLCNAVRSIVAPAIAGMIAQDQMIDRGRDLVQDMLNMHLSGADNWVELDNMRLSNVVDGVAQNNIKVHRLLDRLAKVSLKDPVEATELSSLRSRLLDIADEQAESLNLLSGTADTEALSELQGFANPMAAMLQPDVRPGPVTEGTGTQEKPESSPPPPDASHELAAKQSVTGREESPIVALVRPIVEQCR
ncbi:MAG: hypothetical protein JO322_13375 [Candidatus Eremiobacteraeota bacterium]|nr:hypothetical protein [Candidatus Eremiobacteraeota bacterium]